MSIQENPTMEKNKVDKVMEYILNTPENTNPAILKSMLEDLSSEGGEGGGGESDFSTAEVTFVNAPINVMFPVISDDPGASGIICPWAPTEDDTVHIALYKGHFFYNDYNNRIGNVSGSIQYDETLHLYDISGDCTITFGSPA